MMARQQTDICCELLVYLVPERWAQWPFGLDEVIVRDFIPVPCRSGRTVRSNRSSRFIHINREEQLERG